MKGKLTRWNDEKGFGFIRPTDGGRDTTPKWFARTYLGITELDVNIAHILRAVMCLYLALGVFWLFSAFDVRYRNTAILTTGIFAGGLVSGRIISLYADGQPQSILVLYIVLEFVLVPMAYWVFKLPE